MKDINVEAMYGDEVVISRSDDDIKIHFFYGLDGETLYFTPVQARELIAAISTFLPEGRDE